MTHVKICGIKDKEHALATVEAGADFIGLVFAPSKRQVNLKEAREIANVVKKGSNTTRPSPDKGRVRESLFPSPQVVGVFVNMPVPKVNEIADFCDLDWVQLSGDESWEYCRGITKPIIKAIRIGQQHSEEICIELTAGAKMLCTQRFIALLDSQVGDKYGGTGITFNWNLAQQVARNFPVIIAGGLDTENVAQVIKLVRPWGVDVSSGVEIEGSKDAAKIRTFIEVVRKADDSKR